MSHLEAVARHIVLGQLEPAKEVIATLEGLASSQGASSLGPSAGGGGAAGGGSSELLMPVAALRDVLKLTQCWFDTSKGFTRLSEKELSDFAASLGKHLGKSKLPAADVLRWTNVGAAYVDVARMWRSALGIVTAKLPKKEATAEDLCGDSGITCSSWHTRVTREKWKEGASLADAAAQLPESPTPCEYISFLPGTVAECMFLVSDVQRHIFVAPNLLLAIPSLAGLRNALGNIVTFAHRVNRDLSRQRQSLQPVSGAVRAHPNHGLADTTLSNCGFVTALNNICDGFVVTAQIVFASVLRPDVPAPTPHGNESDRNGGRMLLTPQAAGASRTSPRASPRTSRVGDNASFASDGSGVGSPGGGIAPASLFSRLLSRSKRGSSMAVRDSAAADGSPVACLHDVLRTVDSEVTIGILIQPRFLADASSQGGLQLWSSNLFTTAPVFPTSQTGVGGYVWCPWHSPPPIAPPQHRGGAAAHRALVEAFASRISELRQAESECDADAFSDILGQRYFVLGPLKQPLHKAPFLLVAQTNGAVGGSGGGGGGGVTDARKAAATEARRELDARAKDVFAAMRHAYRHWMMIPQLAGLRFCS